VTSTPPIHWSRRRLRRLTGALIVIAGASLLTAYLIVGFGVDPDDTESDGQATLDLWPDPQTPTSGDPLSEAIADLTEALDDADLMSALQRQTRDADPDRERSEAAKHPAGDSFFMRYSYGFPRVSDDIKRRFQAVAISNDPDHRLALLAPLEHHSSPPVRYRALLEMARTGLRSRPDSPDEASLELLRRALQQPTTPVAMKADAWFLLGMAQHHRGETLAALTSLDQAIELDPYYFDARVTRLEALQTALVAGRRLGGTRDQCLARLADLLDDIKWIGVLAENRRQFLDLAGQLDTISGRGYAVKPFLIAIARLLGGDPGAAVDGFDRALAADKRLPQGCHGRLLHEIHLLRKTAIERLSQKNGKPKT